MEIKNLQKHIRTLAILEETEAPVISCYLHLEGGEKGFKDFLKERMHILSGTHTGQIRQYLDEAFCFIKDFLKIGVSPDTKGVAIFARGGPKPFFLPLQFYVLLENWISVDTTPNIYPLVELKNNYDRYVLMISTKGEARIVEVNLGQVTKQLWEKRPKLRGRVGREWTKEHYQNHRRERTNRFIREKIKVLEKIMSTGGHTQLILAGHPTMTARVHKLLPKHLKAKLVDIFSASQDNKISKVVALALSNFIEQTAKESLAMVGKLQQQINTNGLAVVGIRGSLKVLRKGQVDVLILAKSFDGHVVWICNHCGNIEPEFTSLCGSCGDSQWQKINTKQEAVRFAEQNGCKVEIVHDSDVLMELGGIGCLLRYKTPEKFFGNIHPTAEKMKIKSTGEMHKKRKSESYVNFM